MIPSPDHPAARWGELSQAERDAAYNNATAVADSPALNKIRNETSAAFRAANTIGLDKAYGPTQRNAWDIYPGGDPDAPCLVFIHGGYWQMNARENFAVLAQGMLAHGWSVALPGYTLAPEASLTQIVAEIHQALDWLAANGKAHGAGGRIIVSGWSAGGHLTAMALSHPAVEAGFALSGIYELGPIRDTYLNAKLKLSDEEIAILSPLRLPVVDKPMSIAFGGLEVLALVEDARALHTKRSRAQAAGMLVPVPHANHFTILDHLKRPDGELCRHLLAIAEAL
jgi:acetyl esterase/lipase